MRKVTISKDHVCAALEGYLKALSMINDEDRVTEVSGSGTHFTVITEREEN